MTIELAEDRKEVEGKEVPDLEFFLVKALELLEKIEQNTRK